MILIFGGAYQGKLDYAKEHFEIEEVRDCRQAVGTETSRQASDADGSAGTDPEAVADRQTDRQAEETVAQAAGAGTGGQPASEQPQGWLCHEPDLSADAICGIEAFARECAEKGIEAADWFRERRELWQDKVLIMRDVSQGIVPMDPLTRKYREMNGRLMLYLAGEAEQVIRVFCGIGKRIK